MEAKTNEINLNAIIDKSIKNNKHPLLFFNMTHCGYCKRMKNRTFKNSNVSKRLSKNFTFIDINIDHLGKIVFNKKNYSHKEFTNIIDVDFYPTVLFFDQNYDVIYTSRGYRNSEKFNKILKFIETKAYKKVDFFDFEEE